MCCAGGGGRLCPTAMLVPPPPKFAAAARAWMGAGLGYQCPPPPHFGAAAQVPVLLLGVSGPVSSCSSANSPPACANEVPRSRDDIINSLYKVTGCRS